ncbi:MAG TPA: MTH938/NDUFAF3 family protein [Pseudolabrys sp.]|nr:MTH938/NDUFAF3 family protein [Pseudolabrys sp.]
MAAGGSADTPHLPQPAPIDAYGEGGFRFAGMSHRGSLLCFPDGIWAWPVQDAAHLTEAALAAAFDRAQTLDFFLIGAGRDPWILPEDLRRRFRDLSLSVDAMPTGAAVRTYNILLAENRRVGAGLIAVA